MTLVNPKPAGYAFGEKLPSAHVNSVWSQLVYAIDGNAGGTYAPSSAIVIGGSGLQVTGSCQVSGPLVASGVVTLGDSALDAIAISGTAVFAPAVTFQNGFTVSAGGFAVTAGLATFGAGITVSAGLTTLGAGLLVSSGGLTVTAGGLTVDAGGGTITGGLTLIGGTFSAGSGSFSSTATFNGDVAVNNPLTLGGDGRVRMRTVTTPTLTDANATITPVTADAYYMPTGTLSTNRQWTIDDTGCANGDWIIVVNHDATNSIAVRDPTPTTIVTIQRATGVASAALVMRIAGTWRVLFEGKF